MRLERREQAEECVNEDGQGARITRRVITPEGKGKEGSQRVTEKYKENWGQLLPERSHEDENSERRAKCPSLRQLGKKQICN
jgi:IMP dehydrogenase/GMP reductase